MIKLTKIDSEFTIYKGKKVILWGCGYFGKLFLDLFENYNIKVFALCDNDENLWNTTINGVKVMSPAELKLLSKENSNLLIQLSFQTKSELSILKQLSELEIDYISFEEARWALQFRRNIDIFSSSKSVKFSSDEYNIIIRHQRSWFLYNALSRYMKDIIILYLPAKTADFTLNNIFSINDIPALNMWAQPKSMDIEYFKTLYSPVKIITAVREPIGQNISLVYSLTTRMDEFDVMQQFMLNFDAKYKTHEGLIKLFFKDGGNVQELFDAYLNSKNYPKADNPINVDSFSHSWHIQHCMNRFRKEVIDIYAHPFDKEKGYAIMRENNVEVFVYQLEKLNNIIPELSDWVGVPFDKLESANVGADKWTGESYKQAQRELTFSQEYFDACYNEPYVKHFYSDEDIEKFKARWRPHIR